MDLNAAVSLEDLQRLRLEFTGALLAKNTRLGYGYGWVQFQKWTASVGLPSLPASEDSVALFVVALLASGRKVSTAAARCAAIRRAHFAAHEASPVTQVVADLLRAARRVKGEQPRQALPPSIAELRQVSLLLIADHSDIGARNAAILLTQFLAAFRNSETAALMYPSDVTFTALGVSLYQRKGKMDQESKGVMKALIHGKNPATDPVGALRTWIAIRGDWSGPLFSRLECRGNAKDKALDPERIGQIVQRSFRRIGIETTGHGPRAGLVTALGEAGCSDLQIAGQTGHKDMATVRRYFRKRDAFLKTPLARLNF